MKTMNIIPALLALATAPLAVADITAPGNASAHAQDCDLLAANTVRATLQQTREITRTDPVTGLQESYQVAVFQVVENLAYKKYVRYGAAQMEPGQLFTVELRQNVPGQSTGVVHEIAQMQPGEEAVIKMEHLYQMKGATPTPVNACTRIARKDKEDAPLAPLQPAAPQDTAGSPDVAPAPALPEDDDAEDGSLPTSVAPLGGTPRRGGSASISPGFGFGNLPGTITVGNGGSSNSHMQISFGGNGGQMESVEVQEYYDSRTGKRVKRMFVNGEEVDPDTRKPLSTAAAKPAKTASPAKAADPVKNATKAPAAPKAPARPATAPGSDTILESTQPGISEEDSF